MIALNLWVFQGAGYILLLAPMVAGAHSAYRLAIISKQLRHRAAQTSS
jgi:hypothetical protein